MTGSNDGQVLDLAVSPDGTTLFLATHVGLFRSTTAGTSWNSVLTFDTQALAFEGGGEFLYVGLADGRVLVSGDAGLRLGGRGGLMNMALELARSGVLHRTAG